MARPAHSLALATLRRCFFGVEARDLVSFVGAAVFLLSVALVATLLPAQRAARIDPLAALTTCP